MKRVLSVCLFVLATATISSAQTTLYFPHVVNGLLSGANVWKTSIFLTNPAAAGTANATVTITFTQQNATLTGAGSAFNIALVDQNGAAIPGSGGSTVSFQIAGGQTELMISTGGGAYTAGFAAISSTQPINGTAVFSEFDATGTQLIEEAGVPAVSAVAHQSIFVDTVGGYNIGVAFANPSATASAAVTLSLFNTSGAQVATTTGTVGPGNHDAAFTSQFFTSFTTQIAGTMEILSGATTPLAAVGLRFDPTFAIFTTLPPVTIASLLNPTIEWLGHSHWLSAFGSLAHLLVPLNARIG
jgi:hypothetical protein